LIGTANEYTNKVYQSIISNWHNLMAAGCMYDGKEGAKRLAREYGRGLADFSEKEAWNELKGSYGSLCVKLYNLKPPIDAKVWNKEVIKGAGL